MAMHWFSTLVQFSLYHSMWFTCVALKSISKRVAQAGNTLKSAENGNPIEELCIILAVVLELEIHMFRPVKIGGTMIVSVTYVGIFYLINLYGFCHGKCEQILAKSFISFCSFSAACTFMRTWQKTKNLHLSCVRRENTFSVPFRFDFLTASRKKIRILLGREKMSLK